MKKRRRKKGRGGRGRRVWPQPLIPNGEEILSQCKGKEVGPPSLSPMTRPPSLLPKGRPPTPCLERKRNMKEKRRRRTRGRDEEEKKEHSEEDPSLPKSEETLSNATGKA